MAWDISTPNGTETLANGGARIRELKTDLQTALRGNAVDGTEAKFPGSDTSNPIYRYRGLRGVTGDRPTAGQYGLYANTTLNSLQRDNGTSWENVATLIPAGTVALFFQAAPPTGWTQIVTQNDKMLRIVSGAGGGTGGSTAFTSCWAATVTGSGGNHTPTINSFGTVSLFGELGGGGSGSAGDDHTHDVVFNEVPTHTHSVTAYAPKYVDLILASKD